MDDTWIFGRRILLCNFWLSWVGIFLLLVASVLGKNDSNASSMFGALALNLSATVTVVVGGKATEHLVNTRWGSDGGQETNASSSVQGGAS